mmetsp:Transcript_25558/g.59475  ORF Transcript_25558/g.59475 Transcript_25558/m.59475 type:complete len:243 (+) Transcript_25558:263-991(+)
MQHADLLLVLDSERGWVQELVALTIHLQECHHGPLPTKDHVDGSALVDAPARQQVLRGHDESQQPAEGQDLQLLVPRVLLPFQQLAVQYLIHAQSVRMPPELARLPSSKGVDVGEEQHLGIGKQLRCLRAKLKNWRGILASPSVHAADHSSDALRPAAEPGAHRAHRHDRVDDLVAPLSLCAVHLHLVGHLGVFGNSSVEQHWCLDGLLALGLVLLEYLPGPLADRERQAPDVVHGRAGLAP